MNISAGLIPHKEFHNGIWLRSNSENGWHYFLKKKNDNQITNKNFLKSVDVPLQELVRFLHKNGIKTTPSCSGHCYKKSGLSNIYKSIESEGDKIRRKGIELMDIESGKKMFYADDEYTLPWNKKEFVDQLHDYQQNGIIGVRPGINRVLAKRLMEIDLPHIEVERSGPVILLATTGNGKNDNAAIWNKVTRELKKLVKL